MDRKIIAKGNLKIHFFLLVFLINFITILDRYSSPAIKFYVINYKRKLFVIYIIKTFRVLPLIEPPDAGSRIVAARIARLPRS